MQRAGAVVMGVRKAGEIGVSAIAHSRPEHPHALLTDDALEVACATCLQMIQGAADKRDRREAQAEYVELLAERGHRDSIAHGLPF